MPLRGGNKEVGWSERERRKGEKSQRHCFEQDDIAAWRRVPLRPRRRPPSPLSGVVLSAANKGLVVVT